MQNLYFKGAKPPKQPKGKKKRKEEKYFLKNRN